MSVALCILAKDEGRSIGGALARLARQSLITNDDRTITVHVVANGCTDETVDIARQQMPLFEGQRRRLEVHELHPAGKSRAWNRTVHQLIEASTDIVVFVDADIRLVDDDVLARLVAALESDPRLAVCSGFPIKDAIAKSRKSLLDRFSLAVSNRSRHANVINGSLYAARGKCLQQIWLPDDTPGEDGFLNAMVTTRGFTQPPAVEVVATLTEPTHYFHAHGPLEFIGHERRMIVGTIINRWVFEHLWELDAKLPVGPLIGEWNVADPDWVERLIRGRVSNKHWLIPISILLGRFRNIGARSFLKNVAYVPLAVAATLLTLPPAISANQRLKRFGAAKTW